MTPEYRSSCSDFLSARADTRLRRFQSPANRADALLWTNGLFGSVGCGAPGYRRIEVNRRGRPVKRRRPWPVAYRPVISMAPVRTMLAPGGQDADDGCAMPRSHLSVALDAAVYTLAVLGSTSNLRAVQ